jgi:hypothetical protein
MPVRPSRPVDVNALIAQLSHADPVVRESATARLVLIGDAAVPALRQLVSSADAPPSPRISALRTLSTIHRPAALDAAAAAAVGADVPLALDAIDLLGAALSDAADPHGADLALEHLTRLALDTAVAERRRLLVMDSLRRLPAALRRPIFDVLATDAAPVIATRATDTDAIPHGALERWSDDDRLPHDPEVLADAIGREGRQTPITVLSRLVELVRAREKASVDVERDAWYSIRGRLHEALAQRGSAIALYDLREALEDVRRPVSAHVLTAAVTVADATCLDAIAARWVHAGDDIWLRDQLERIFQTIVSRDRLRRTSAVVTRVLKRHPAAGPLVATTPRTRPPTA